MAAGDCHIPAFNHIDGDLKKTLMSFSESRPVVAAYALGATRAAMDFTWARLAEIGIVPDYNATVTQRSAAADRMLSLEAEWEATWVAVLRAKWVEQNEGPGKIDSSVAKAMGGGLARRVTQHCIEVLGACGLSAHHRIEKWFRDAPHLRHLRRNWRDPAPHHCPRASWLYAERTELTGGADRGRSAENCVDHRGFDITTATWRRDSAQRPPASVIDRMVHSAFGGGRLLEFLAGHHVDTLIVSGGETDVCVLSTVLSAIDLGYRIILVEDALCSSSDESHDAILGLYQQRFDIQVGVANLEQILGLWKPD